VDMESHRHTSHVGGGSGMGILLTLGSYMCYHLVTNTGDIQADIGI
jgi:hypothetical protein